MRLARTEIAAAYRRAAWESFQDDPRITGIRILLSNNHTCINPRTGKPEPFHDICDELAGDYPKSFLWTGWHPQCRCVMLPIVISGDEATKFIDAKVNGEKYTPKQIKSVPSQLQKWMEKNRGRIDAANNRGTLPYWIKDNAKYAGMKINPINEAAQPEIRKEALSKYNAYDSDWEKAYFDRYSGGYVVTDKQRIEHSKVSKNEKAKYDKEIEMSIVFAKNGYKIELLKEIPRISSPDAKINGVFADLKRVSGHNNIVKDAKKAVRKQGAEIVLFEFDAMTHSIKNELDKLKKLGINVKYFIAGTDKVIDP
jgi:hypothetical protein